MTSEIAGDFDVSEGDTRLEGGSNRGNQSRGFGRTTVESTSRRAAATSSRRNRAIVAADCPLGL